MAPGDSQAGGGRIIQTLFTSEMGKSAADLAQDFEIS